MISRCLDRFATALTKLARNDDHVPTSIFSARRLRPRSLTAIGLALLALLPACATGAARPASSRQGDKSGYNLFNPTPRQQWRPMSSDRPDVTESPITVDAGAMQAEMSFVDVITADGDRTVKAMATNYKFGITNNMDLQVVFDPYVSAQNGPLDSDGFGLTQLRWKINLWDNDDGGSALGVLPFIQAPTAADGLGSDEVEGGASRSRRPSPTAWASA